MMPQHHLPADIERTSMKIITGELAQRGLDIPPENAPVVKRVIHTTADFDYAQTLHFTPGAVAAGIAAMHAGATIITDTNMALAGITKPGLAKLGGQALCFMADPAVAAAAKQAGTTRAVAAMHKAAAEYPGAVLCERGGKQGAPVCRVRKPRRARHCCHGPQGRQQRGGGHLQRADLFRRRNAGPHRPRMEISRRISPQPGTALFGAKRIPGYCYLTAAL